MSVWSAILGKLQGVLNSMVGAKTIEKELKISPIISSAMEIAISEWSNLYKGKASWLHEPSDENPTRIVSLGLPALIASEKARTALLEFNSEITTPTKEFEVENPNYKAPPTEPDELGNIIPTMEPPVITEDRPVSDTQRAEFLEEQYKKLKKQLRKQIEYGVAKGGLVIKPYPVIISFGDNDKQKQNNEQQQAEEPKEENAQMISGQANSEQPSQNQDNQEDKEKRQEFSKEQQAIPTKYSIEFDFVQADCFYPVAFNTSGQITEAVFLDIKTEKNFVYRRLEYHKWVKGALTVINKAYKAPIIPNTSNREIVDLGKEIKLTEVPEWEQLQEKVTIAPVEKPLFAYFKMPEANTIDLTSPLGVSGYARVVNLIKDADMQYSRMLWEFEAGEMAIDIDRDALNFVTQGVDRNGKVTGKSKLNKMQQRLFRKVDLGNDGEMYSVFAPALRDASLLQGLNAILMRIEDGTGLSRGTLSDAATEARTATELKILKQRSYQTNADIQQAIEDALRDVIYAMNVYCDLYEITPDGEYDVNFEWDDSIIVDVDTELNKRIMLMQNGLASKVETRMWYFGETERQAQEALQKVNEDSRDQMEQDLIMQGNLNRGNNEENPFNKKPKQNKVENK